MFNKCNTGADRNLFPLIGFKIKYVFFFFFFNEVEADATNYRLEVTSPVQ